MSLPSAAGPSRQWLSMSSRRRQRACDACRHKKTKCDGRLRPEGDRCKRCRDQDLACVYRESQRDPDPINLTVLELQQKLERMESLLAKVSPCADMRTLEQSIQNPGFSESTFSSMSQAEASDPAEDDYEDGASSEDEVFVEPDVETIINGVRNMSVTARTRFYGKSSGMHGVRRAMQTDPEMWNRSVQQPFVPPHFLRVKRSEIWTTPPWERDSDTPSRWHHNGQYVFPEDDLMPELFELYFTRVNAHQPLLHRPTFTANVVSGLHRRDRIFGAIVLLVCALGARFSDDPRVLLDGFRSLYSAGHKWFRQVEGLHNTALTQSITLFEMQMNCLLVAHCQWAGQSQACWNLVGLTIRRAQDIGVHRKSFFSGRISPVDEELWKRAIWVAVLHDRYMGTALGRPLALYDDDFDLDLPAECDEEYWIADDPAQSFRQPPGKISSVTAFNLIMKLQRITALALRTIYTVDKSGNNVFLRMIGSEWEQRMVVELDSMLNKWLDSIPDELRLDVGNQDEKPLPLFDQTTSIWMFYYHAQILIHRPFIDARKQVALAQPSLVICTNAARAGSQLVSRHYRRSRMTLPFVPLPLFMCGIVLLLNIRNRVLHNVSLADAKRDMEYVDMNIQALLEGEKKWQVAGRLCDILRELRSVVVGGDEELKTSTQAGDAVPSPTVPGHELPAHLEASTCRECEHTDRMGSPSERMPKRYLEELTLPHHQQSRDSMQPSSSSALKDGLFPVYGAMRGLVEASPFFGQPASPLDDAQQQQPLPQQGFWNDLAAQTHALDFHWGAMEGVETDRPTLMCDPMNVTGSGAATFTGTAEWDAYIASVMAGQPDPHFVQSSREQ